MGRLEEMRVDGAGEGRTLFIPPMEPYGAPLVAGVFRSIGYDAHVLQETDETLALGLKHTGGGECVPCPTTVGSLIRAMQERDLPPEKVIFFMPTACGPCRFGQYAKLDAIIFEKLGWGDIRIMSPSAENAYEGVPTSARMLLWHALLLGDILRKLACKVRPYEVTPGETDGVLAEWSVRLEKAFETGSAAPVSELLASTVAAVGQIPTRPAPRPLVGIVGEIYVRCNPFVNGDLIRRIEALGGEAWLAPIGEWLLYTNHLRGLLLREQGRGVSKVLETVRLWLETHAFFEKWEHHYYEIARPVLHDRMEHPIDEVIEEGCRYLPWQFEGEAVLTLGRAKLFVERDGCKALVNASPMFCMPGTVTTSIFPAMERELGVPIVCTFYDGSGDPNQSLVPVMHYLCEAEHAAASSAPAPAVGGA
jgi:predicted nucleotide-binding protein (sugar kinase/HSP70/actin superfamily)